VIEACRLLRQSIIQIETDQIDLQQELGDDHDAEEVCVAE
jgi:hypothetical protein